VVIPTAISSQLIQSVSKYGLHITTMKPFSWHRIRVPKGLIDSLIKQL
jgi:hypothetical protein